jgi:predicted phage baseplate assembly protein
VLERRDPDPAVRWEWRPYLVGPGASTPDDRHVTLDDGTWGPAVTYQRAGAAIVHLDWLSGAGHTVRFGDGEFGVSPADGTRFEVRYRLGNGRAGNVPIDAITHHGSADPLIAGVTNPLAVTDGQEPESVGEARHVVPYEWQTVAYRAVRTEDYAEALTRLDWVQGAGAVSRWTGSWLSIIATPDPVDAVALDDAWRADGRRQLDRFRQAGRAVALGEPRYADIDIDIEVCVEVSSYRAEVARRVLAALVGDPRDPSAPYFFDPDEFVFGEPLYRAALDAAVQRVPGVRAVESTTYRRRGHFDWRPIPAVVTVTADELIRVANDRAHPERGTVRIVPRGGA